MASGRGRLSFWDTLPEWADGVRIWAYAELAERKLTQLEILDELNKRLRAAAWEEGIAANVPQASKSSLNRLAMRRAGMIRKQAEAKALYEGLATQFDHKSSDESTIVLGEFLKTLVLELADGATETPKQAMELARAYLAIIQGMKISTDRRTKLEAEFEAKTEMVIKHVAKEGGLSAETIAQLRREFLGVRPKPPEAPDAARP